MQKITELLPFLTSTRYWQIVVAAVVTYMGAKGWIDSDLVLLIDAVTLGSVGIRTVDRFAEKAGDKDTK